MALLKTVEELKKSGTTVVIITHRQNILKATNKIVLMNSGRIEKYGISDDILGNAAKQSQAAQAIQRPAQIAPQQINLSKPGS